MLVLLSLLVVLLLPACGLSYAAFRRRVAGAHDAALAARRQIGERMNQLTAAHQALREETAAEAGGSAVPLPTPEPARPRRRPSAPRSAPARRLSGLTDSPS